MIFANTDKEITLIYHSDEHIGKQILAYAHTENLPIHAVDLAHEKLAKTHWAEIANRMGLVVQELVNTNDANFLQRFQDQNNFSEDDWLTLLVHNPRILKAPVVMKGKKVVMMNNPQDMLHFVEAKH